MGKQGKASPFSEEQLRVLDSYEAPMELFLRQHNLHAGKHARGTADLDVVKKWFEEARTTILDHPEFKGKLDYTQRTESQWSDAVKERLKNTRYNKIVKRNFKAAATMNLHATTTTNTFTASGSGTEKALDVVRELGKIRTIKSGKELFEQENSTRIKTLARAKRDEDTSLNPGAAYQMALTELWSGADQESFDARVEKEGVGDVFENQSTFQRFLYEALIAVCESGYFGPCEIVLYAGYRDKENVARIVRVDASSDPTSDAQFLQGDEKMNETIHDAWFSFVDERLPAHPTTEGPANEDKYKIPFNSAGVPVFPDVDENDITFSDFKNTYGKWIQALWEFSWPKDPTMASMPVADLLAHPHLFYDTETYTFPGSLTSPDLLRRNTMFEYLVYLKSVSNTQIEHPFVFRSKTAIEQGLNATQARVEHERHTGDEITMDTNEDDECRSLVKAVDHSERHSGDVLDDVVASAASDPQHVGGLAASGVSDSADRLNELTKPTRAPRKGNGKKKANTQRSGKATGTVLSQPSGLHHADSVPSSLVPEPVQTTSITPIPSDEAPSPSSPLPSPSLLSPLLNPPSERSLPHAHPAPQTGSASNCPPSLKRKRGKNVVVESGSDGTVEKAVEEAVEEAAGSIAPKAKKRRGKTQVVQSGVDETATEADGNVAPEPKKKANKYWGYGLAPSKGTLERSPEKVSGRTRAQARKTAQA